MADETSPDPGTYSEAEPADADNAHDAGVAGIWRRNLRYILLALGCGIVVGTPILIFAFEIPGTAAPLYPRLFFVGGLSIVFGPAALTVYETWRACNKLSRKLGNVR